MKRLLPSGLRRIARRARALVRSQAVILLYHRIADAENDPWNLCVSPRNFADQLAALDEHATSLPFSSLVRHLKDKKLPYRSVALTFDDGYADNLLTALPLIENRGVTASFFIATGFMGRPAYWWDRVQDVFLHAAPLPPSLEITIEGRSYRWTFGEALPDAYPAWKGWEPPPTPRHAAFRTLWELLRTLPPSQQNVVLATLEQWAGRSYKPVSATRRPLTLDELRTLASSPHSEIGAHTVSHPRLPALSLADQRDEIVGSRDFLQEHVGHPVRTFTYPHGARNEDTEAVLRANGFEASCTTDSGVVHTRSDALRLPRLVVGDWDGETLLEHLDALHR